MMVKLMYGAVRAWFVVSAGAVVTLPSSVYGFIAMPSSSTCTVNRGAASIQGYSSSSSSCTSSRLILSSSSTTTTTTTTTTEGTSTSSTSVVGIIGTPITEFDDGKRPYEITTPIYYVNDRPHIGHAYTSIACDVIARFMRLSGRDVYFVSGTDEHGQKVELSASTKFGGYKQTQDFVDEMSKSFSDLLILLNISNDKFIRTTSSEHKESVQHLWNVLVDKGYIYKGTYSGWYSVRDECFYNESELIDGNKAPTGADVEWVAKEESYFFKLSEFENKLLELYELHPEMIAPTTRKNEVFSFVKSGLRDLSVSRTSFQWGVPVPGDEDHVMYVWIDALANYISALGYPPRRRSDDDDDDDDDDGNNNNNNNFDKFWPAGVHIVGKDILRFHAVYWPAFLMAADLPVPKRIFAHGWWTKDGEKISKSLGNVIDPVDLVDKYGVDPTRFFLMSEVPFGNDGDYSDSAMIYKCNANLANQLGSLSFRVCSLAHKNCNQAVPVPQEELTADDKELLDNCKNLREKAATAIANQALSQYANVMIQSIKDAQKYIDIMEPWKLKKTDPNRMATVLYVLMEALRYSTILYQPLIPDSANKILDQLTVPTDQRTFEHLDSSPLEPGTSMDQPQIVLSRFEVPVEEEGDKAKQQKKQKKQKQKQKAPPAAATANVSAEIDISRLDIRVGVITKAWEHEDADKLFCEEIDIGEESGPRQIASGLREYYNLDELEGRRVLVLANLKARKLVGFPSHGMVLCASTSDDEENKVEFVEPPIDAKIGERVYVEGYPGDPATGNQIDKKKMLNIIFPDLKTDINGIATYKGAPLLTRSGECKAQSGLPDAAVA